MVSFTANLRLRVPVFDQEPWDEDINGDLHVIDAAIGKFFGVANIVGVWRNSTAYIPGQSVVDDIDGSIWTCMISHTSSAAPLTFEQDRAAFPSYWHESVSSAKEYAEIASAYATTASNAATAAAGSATDAANSAAVAAGALPLTGGTMTGPIILAADPVDVLGAASKQYVDARVGGVGFLPTTGGTMTGPITLFGNPTAPLQSTPKQYVDTFMPRSGGFFSGPITLAGDPTGALSPATKQYVDNSYMPRSGGAFTGNISAPYITASNTLQGNALNLNGGASWQMDASWTYMYMDPGAWRWQYQRSTGAMLYVRGYDGATLFSIDGGGSINAPGRITAGEHLWSNNGVMSSNGGFYIGGNLAYKLQREPSTGDWVFYENNQWNFAARSNGSIESRSFAVIGSNGVQYSGYGGSKFALQWDGTGVFLWIDGSNMDYLIRTVNIPGTYARIYRQALNVNGSMSAWYPGGDVSWSITWSDRRLKSNIQPTRVDALSQINRLKVYECDFKAPIEKAPTQHLECALLADEVGEVVPSAYVKAKEGENSYDQIREMPLIVMLIRGMQQMNTRIEQLEMRLAAQAGAAE